MFLIQRHSRGGGVKEEAALTRSRLWVSQSISFSIGAFSHYLKLAHSSEPFGVITLYFTFLLYADLEICLYSPEQNLVKFCFVYSEIEKIQKGLSKKDDEENYLDLFSHKNMKLKERVLIPVKQYPKVRQKVHHFSVFVHVCYGL